MQERFILSNLNERELLRTLSLNGNVSFNTHILNSTKLAEEVLLRNGIVLKGEKIDSFKQSCIIFNLINKVDYFKGSNFNDCKNITKELNIARMLCRGNESDKLTEVLGDGEFPEKNKAILDLYKLYKEELKNKNEYDSIDLINYVINNKLFIDGEFVYFKQDKLKPLEEELLKIVSNDNCKKEDLIKYCGNTNKQLTGCTYDDSYGAINEIEHIIAYISKNKIKYEDVLIVLNDQSYFNQLYEYGRLYEIPMSFTMGYPIGITYPFHLYNLLTKWDKGYNACNPLMDLLNAPEFNLDLFWDNVSQYLLKAKIKSDVLSAVGSLRLSTTTPDKIIEDYKSTFKKDDENIVVCNTVVNIANEFKKGYIYLLNTYTNKRNLNPDFDTAGLNIITKTIEEYTSSIKGATPADAYDEIVSKSICKQSSAPGTICVCNLKDALSINRKHVFITGLSAKTFPGSPKENYLLLDSDLKRFNEDNIPLSDSVIKDKKDLLMNVVDFANSFGSSIHISYAGYSLIDLKTENPSSMIFEIFKKEKGDAVTMDDLNEKIGKQHRYFDEEISKNTFIGDQYINGTDISTDTLIDKEVKPFYLTWPISPSAADKFYECPKRFYLKYILGLNEPNNDDPFKLFPGGAAGTLVHECMEDYGHNPDWMLDEFMDNAKAKFNNYLKCRITVHSKDLEKNKSDYLEMAKNGYENDPTGKTIIGSEYKVNPVKHESGLTFSGTIDRIEKLDNGNHVIVDYKTYSKIKNEADNIDTCFQVVLYAYLLEALGKKVDRCEYRYLRNVRTITTEYNDGIKQQLNEKINKLKEALDSGIFNYAEDKKACDYCPYIDICGKYNTNQTVEEIKEAEE